MKNLFLKPANFYLFLTNSTKKLYMKFKKYPTKAEIEDKVYKQIDINSFDKKYIGNINLEYDKEIMTCYISEENINNINNILDIYTNDYNLYKAVCNKINKRPISKNKFNDLIECLKHCAINNFYKHSYMIKERIGCPKDCIICKNAI